MSWNTNINTFTIKKARTMRPMSPLRPARIRVPATAARTRFEAGPASTTMSESRLRLRNEVGSSGVGFA